MRASIAYGTALRVEGVWTTALRVENSKIDSAVSLLWTALNNCGVTALTDSAAIAALGVRSGEHVCLHAISSKLGARSSN